MAATTDIQTFALGVGANVLSPAAYKALTSLIAGGYITGTALSVQVNTTLRQSAFMAAGLANFCVAQGISVPDDGNLTNLVAEIEAALQAFVSSTFGSLPLFRKAVSLNINTANNGSYNLTGQAITFPGASAAGQFRIKARASLNGESINIGGGDGIVQQNYIMGLTDGTTTITGPALLLYIDQPNTGAGFETTFYFPTSYNPGASATFTASVATLGGSTHSGQLKIQSAELDIQVENA